MEVSFIAKGIVFCLAVIAWQPAIIGSKAVPNLHVIVDKIDLTQSWGLSVTTHFKYFYEYYIVLNHI